MIIVKNSYYAIIPAIVRYDKSLTPNAKLIYGEITALCNERGYCWASNGYFSKLYEVDVRTISRWISQLNKKSYIKTQIIYDDGTKRVKQRNIFINDVPLENYNPDDNNVIGYRQKCDEPTDNDIVRYRQEYHDPIDNKVVDNNTVNTTINNTEITTTTIDEKKNSSDNEFKEISHLYKSCIGQPNGLTIDWIDRHLKEYGFVWLKNALLISEERGKRNKSYVNGILKNWKTEGVMKLGGNSDEGFNENSGTNKPGYSKESDEFFKKAKERGWLDISEEELECDF